MHDLTFYNIGDVDDSLLAFAVIAAKYQGKWVLCKNKTRKWELPGGHREQNEAIIDTAKRELFEETGALHFTLTPVCVYAIDQYGLLCYADISELGALPDSEIEQIGLFDEIPDDLSYPVHHPILLNKIKAIFSI